jgi:hypothetical protein
MNLLEKARSAVDYYDDSMGHIGSVGEEYIRLCRALLGAMEEIEEIELHKNNDYQRAYTAGFDLCKSIFLKHLEVDE